VCPESCPRNLFFVTYKTLGYFRVRGGTILDAVDLMTLPWERETTGFWIDLPNHVLQALNLERVDGAAAIHAAEHAFLNQFILSDDVKTECRVVNEAYKDSESPSKRFPRLIFYDAPGKTGGVVAKAFDHVHVILDRACKAVDNCDCVDGCPSCVQNVICKGTVHGRANLISSKAGASIILNGLFGTNERNTME